MTTMFVASGLWLMAKLFYIGGYTNEIILASMDGQGGLSKIASYPSGENPSILALHPNLPVLYAANEIDSGSVQAFTYDRSSGVLSPLGHPISTLGSSPAFITVDPSGKWLLFANYNGGSYGVGGIDPLTGQLLKTVSLVQVPKSTKPPGNPSRQEGPHPHQIITDFSGKFVFVPDLGNDEIHLGRLQHNGHLESHHPVASVEVVPGSGPRHMVFSPDNRFAYVVNELSNCVDLYVYDSGRGRIQFLNKSWSTLEGAGNRSMTAAEIALSRNGAFLYVSNRGEERDTIAVFSVDCSSGELELQGHDDVGGSGPRHFAMDPSGELVVVGLQNSNKVSLLRRNPVTGRLSLLSSLDGVVHPTYIQFI